MGLLSGFSKKNVQQQLELKITLAKLRQLASFMETGTSKEGDLKLWREAMTALYDNDVKPDYYLTQLKESYHVIYNLYLQKHHPDLLNT